MPTEIASTMVLDQLIDALKKQGVEGGNYYQREHRDGSSETILIFEGVLRASWRARLISMPPRDGVTPRGPKEYYDLKFYELRPKQV
jgi:hypothetical protein